RAQGHQISVQRMNVEPAERRRITLKFGLRFENDLVFVGRFIYLRNLPRAERVAQGGLNLRDRNVVGGGLLAIDLDVDLWRVDLQVAVYVLKNLHLTHFSLEQRRRIRQI